MHSNEQILAASESGDRSAYVERITRDWRRPVRSGRQTMTLVLDQAPKFVGVDPFNKRIDRNSEDNLTSVKLE